jgi:general secretion pathway protein C
MPARLLGLGESLVLAGVGLAAARLIWLAAMPAGPVGDWPGQQAAAPLLAALPAVDPFNKGGTATAGEAVVSDLDLVLAGTRVDAASGRGSAIIAAGDGVQQSFAVGDEVIPGVRLVAVAFDSITLARDGVNETLFLDQSSGPVPVVPAGDAGTRPRLLADLALVPRLEGTRITGFILNPKGSGQAFAAAGLRAGDVLVAVDGQSVAQVRDPAVLAQRLDGGGAQVTIERGGKPITFKVQA